MTSYGVNKLKNKLLLFVFALQTQLEPDVLSTKYECGQSQQGSHSAGTITGKDQTFLYLLSSVYFRTNFSGFKSKTFH